MAFNLANRKKKVYFIGIGGMGMSALARWFMSQKWAVSGSDLIPSRITRELQKEGAEVNFGHKKGHIKADLTLIIRSQAVRPDNPELREASRLGIPTITYPEAVGVLTESHETIAVAGAHGKSTTTALVGLILTKAGLDPTIIIGTNMKEFGGKNFRSGHSHHYRHRHSHGSGYLVLEADEFGRAFLHYSPTLAVVTNIDKEHLDTYKNLNGVKKAFLEFLARTKPGGTLILNKDCLLLFSQQSKIRKIAENGNLKIIWYSVRGNTAKKIKKIIKIPGLHNISNAIAAYKVGRVLGVSHKKILAAISAYRGSWRRFEYRGTCHLSHVTCHIYDDYAHHPTEIKATLAAFREKFPKSKIVCVFQPHQTERLRLLFKDFTTAFGSADILILIPTYKVAGRERDKKHVTSDKSSEKLAAAIQKKYPRKLVFYLSNPKKLKSFLINKLKPNTSNLKPIVVMMGAGNIVNYTKYLTKN